MKITVIDKPTDERCLTIESQRVRNNSQDSVLLLYGGFTSLLAPGETFDLTVNSPVSFHGKTWAAKHFAPLVFEGVVPSEFDFRGGFDIEDGGQAVIWQPDYEELIDPDMFVRLQSWDENAVAPRGGPGKRVAPGGHPSFRKLLGKRVRITVEVVEE